MSRYNWAVGGGGPALQWLKLPAWKFGDRGVQTPLTPLQVLKKQNVSPPLTRNDWILCQGSNLESYVWRAVSSPLPQEVLTARFSLYVQKSGRKHISFHFYK